MKLNTTFGKCFCSVEQDVKSEETESSQDQQHAAGNDQ